MIKLTLDEQQLGGDVHRYLARKQREVDRLPAFAEQQDRAETSWKGAPRADKMKRVRAWLKQACVGIGICPYCENNEAADIEHIYPKKLYPGRCFKPDNYLLACKECNTGYKRDRFAVFGGQAPAGVICYDSSTPVHASPQGIAAFINPREDDPMEFLFLDLPTGILLPHPTQSPANKEKAKQTLSILSLNDREALTVYRKDAYTFFMRQLDLCIGIMQAASHQELGALSFPEAVDMHKTLQENQQYAKAQIKARILRAKHITVWHEMLRQHARIQLLQELLDQLPEAFTWR